MILRIRDFSDSSIWYPYNPKEDTFYITHAYDGVDELHFQVSPEDSIYQHLQNETVVYTEDNEFLIKNIDDRGGVVYVDCILNLDDWKNQVYESYRRTNTSLAYAVTGIKPVGWTVELQVSSATATKRTTIEDIEDTPMKAVTPLEILAKIGEIFGVTFIFNVRAKKITVLEPEYYSGLATSEPDKYFSDELNLKSLGYTGNTDEFATRLYAYGALDEDGNPLTFGSINGGNDYIEDKTYCDKTVCIGWSDERYTVKENLLAAARNKLAQICNPVRTYQCDVANLSNDMWMFKAVYVVDRRRKLKVRHICVEYIEYPNAHHLDVCTLATVAPDVAERYNALLAAATKKSQEVTVGTATKLSKQTTEFEQAIVEATQLITGNGGGYKVDILDANGKPQETLYMDTDDMSTAQYVLRLNRSGIGFSTTGVNGSYNTAWTINGTFDASKINVINLNASNIVTGTISDALNNNSWNLITGEFITKYGKIGDLWVQNGYLRYGTSRGFGSECSTVMIGKNGILTAGTETVRYQGQIYETDYATELTKNYLRFTESENLGSKAPIAYFNVRKANAYPAITEPRLYLFMRSPNDDLASYEVFRVEVSDPYYSVLSSKFFAGQPLQTSTVSGTLKITNDLNVLGTKNRVIETDEYGERLFYAYETASPLFGDVGEGVIAEDGECHIFLDPVFIQGISTMGYQVFLQLYGEGSAYVTERNQAYFKVVGTPGLRFGWEIKGRQKDYTDERLENTKEDSPVRYVDYGESAAAYLENLINGRINQ